MVLGEAGLRTLGAGPKHYFRGGASASAARSRAGGHHGNQQGPLYASLSPRPGYTVTRPPALPTQWSRVCWRLCHRPPACPPAATAPFSCLIRKRFWAGDAARTILVAASGHLGLAGGTAEEGAETQGPETVYCLSNLPAVQGRRRGVPERGIDPERSAHLLRLALRLSGTICPAFWLGVISFHPDSHPSPNFSLGQPLF